MKISTNSIHLKDKVLEVLRDKKFSYGDLASHLNITESELDAALEKNTLEIRTLELIAKELRIPLYSFFRKNVEGFEFGKEPYSDLHVWNKDDLKIMNELKSLRQEIEELRLQIHQKDLLIEALEAQIINK